ncbi:hypothetical protein JW824_09360 [bacterium]|nr:hypothetical protein [bacterium]
MKKKNKKSSPTRWRKRLRRIFLGAFLFLFLVILVGCIVLWQLYPSDKLGILVSEKLTKSLERPVQVRSVSINPFGSIDIRDIRVDYLANETTSKEPFLQMERLVIRFKLLPLLRRRLDITNVLLDQPELFIVTDILLKEMQKMRMNKTETEMESGKKISLPVSFGLFRLDLNDFSFSVTMGDSSAESELLFSGIHLDVSDLTLPRELSEEPENVQGQIHLFTEAGRAVFRNQKTLFEMVPNLDLSAIWHSEGKWTFYGDIGFKPVMQEEQSVVRFGLDLEGLGYGESIWINEFDLFDDRQSLVHIEGVMNHLGSDMDYDFLFQGDPINLREIIQTLHPYVQMAGIDFLNDMHLSGLLCLEKGELWGDSQNMHLLCRARIENGSLQNPNGDLDMHQGNFEVTVEGAMAQKGFEKGTMTGDIKVDQFTFAMNDSYSVSVEGLSMHADSKLDSAFVPVEAFATGRVEGVLGGFLGMELNWTADGIKEAREIALKGQIKADSLQFASFPNLGFPVDGSVDLLADVNAHGPQDIRINLVGLSPGIDYGIGNEINKTPPLKMVADMVWRTENTLKIWELDSAAVQLNALFSARLVGELDVVEKAYDFSLVNGIVRNGSVLEFFPTRLKNQLRTLSLDGEEEINLHVYGNRAGDSAIVRIEGNVNLKDVEVDYPAQFLNVKSIQGGLSFEGSSERIGGKGDLTLGSISHNKIGGQSVQGSRIQFDWGMIEQDSLWINRGDIHIEPLAIRGSVSLGVGQMTQSKKLDVEAALNFSSSDSVEILDGTWLQGGFSCRLRGKTIDPIQQWVRLSGELIVDSLDVIKNPVVCIRQIRGVVPFQIDVDLARQALVPEPNFQTLSWVEYENQPTVYRQFSPTIGNLQIQQVDVFGYQLNHLHFDFDIGRGGIQIPWFNMELLDGNLGGSIAICLGDGSKKDIAYEIRANASRIHSAALTDTESGEKEETELDATMAFEGKGIDLEQDIDLDGFFYITKIGTDFASTLLKAMDPQEADRSIRLTRRLLNMGWKPKLFSFELRHGYVYPSLSLTQPWFSPIRIPEYLEYGRLPLAFFLESRSNSE